MGHRTRWIRRISQTAFLLVFLGLLLWAARRGVDTAAGGANQSPAPVGWFLRIDPLIGVATALATGALHTGLVWCLLVLLPTLVFGRFFCGWVCPFGTLHHAMSEVRSAAKLGHRLIALNRYQPWQATKYYVLFAGLAAAVFGSLLLGLLDPISLTARAFTLSVFPSIGYALAAVRDALHATGVGAARLAASVLQFLFQGTLLELKPAHFRQAAVIGLVFGGLLLANLRVTRFWCRALCPLGALLGIASRFSLLRLQKQDSCDACNRCLLHCQGGDDPIPGTLWRRAECHLCLNCVAACPKGDIRFTWGATNPTTEAAPALARRRLLGHVAAGAAIVPVLRSGLGVASEPDPRLIRPPGSVDEPAFLARCIRCGACMRVCPTHALHPAIAEGGLEELWTPVLVPRIGYCEPECVRCSQVCPTGAIWPLTVEEKLGRRRSDPAASGETAPSPVRIGTAFFDRGRCLPWAMATECIVCEEWCPTSPKSILLESVEIRDTTGAVKTVRQPRVDPTRCTGCGACEYACPVRGRPAVSLASVGESRSKTNQLVLPRKQRR